ncbi:dienelactone hydrolase [cyanobiont of Ornithocercus magnificus]|nr:dienelactone hydrolase [cyanobiont of Ornithocercus magnificus]
MSPVTDIVPGHWITIDNALVTLRCWWSPARASNRVVLVLPEVFGVNAWVRSVTDRIASTGTPALAIPLFARSSPTLDLGYSEAELAEGRLHKEATRADQIQADAAAAIAWLQRVVKAGPNPPLVIVLGFCFGGHAALLTSILPQVSSTLIFYGAGVSHSRPGGGPPSLEVLPQIYGQLTYICGSADPLIPISERTAVASAMAVADPSAERLHYIEIPKVGHGFMCEARDTFDAAAAAAGWQLISKHLS